MDNSTLHHVTRLLPPESHLVLLRWVHKSTLLSKCVREDIRPSSRNLWSHEIQSSALNALLEKGIKEGNGKLPQYSCLGNPMDREAWWVAIYGIMSRTQLGN